MNWNQGVFNSKVHVLNHILHNQMQITAVRLFLRKCFDKGPKHQASPKGMKKKKCQRGTSTEVVQYKFAIN